MLASSCPDDKMAGTQHKSAEPWLGLLAHLHRVGCSSCKWGSSRLSAGPVCCLLRGHQEGGSSLPPFCLLHSPPLPDSALQKVLIQIPQQLIENDGDTKNNCVCTHTHIHIGGHTGRYTQVHTQVHAQVHMQTHRYRCRYTPRYTHTDTHTHRYTHTGTHRGIHAGTHTGTCIGIHTQVHISTQVGIYTHKYTCGTHAQVHTQVQTKIMASGLIIDMGKQWKW